LGPCLQYLHRYPILPTLTQSQSLAIVKGVALVLFDIDGTLIRRAGPHHRQALEAAVRRVTGIKSSTEGIPTQGMLDRDILRIMLANAGLSAQAARRVMPDLVAAAQSIYVRGRGPKLHRKVCPGVRMLLWKLHRRAIPTGLVTGNFTAIGWKKMERAGLEHYFRFGAFAEFADDRAGLVKLAIREARRERWIDHASPVFLIGDHPNDIKAAQANGVHSIAVATGVVGAPELATHKPDLLVEDLRAVSVEYFARSSGPVTATNRKK
jgi:phosphoglycolate phosphatase